MSDEQAAAENTTQFNQNLTNSLIRVIGDKYTVCQVVQLLAYIRHAIKEDKPTEIKLKIGTKIAGGQFLFDVNQLEVPDYITQDVVEIN